MSMTTEMLTALSGLGVSLLTAGGGVLVARAARRTPRQERRDDFLAVTERQDRAIERQDMAIEQLEERAARQDEAIGWLLARVRGLVGYIRSTGLEPPAPEPMSERARQYLRHLDV